MRSLVLRRVTLPLALPGPGGALRVMVFLPSGNWWKHTTTSGALLKLYPLRYQCTEVGIRGAHEVWRVVGQPQLSRFNDLHPPLGILQSPVYRSGCDGSGGHHICFVRLEANTQ